jgi:hypothetical protein
VGRENSIVGDPTDPDPAFQVNPDPDTDPGIDSQKLKKYNKIIFFHQLQFAYPYVSIKDV